MLLEMPLEILSLCAEVPYLLMHTTALAHYCFTDTRY